MIRDSDSRITNSKWSAAVLENRPWVRVVEPIRWAGLAALVPVLVWVR